MGIIALVVTVLIVAAIKNSPPAHTVIGGMAFMAFGAFIYLVNSQTGD